MIDGSVGRTVSTCPARQPGGWMGGVGLVHGLWVGECVGIIPAPLAYPSVHWRCKSTTGYFVPGMFIYCAGCARQYTALLILLHLTIAGMRVAAKQSANGSRKRHPQMLKGVNSGDETLPSSFRGETWGFQYICRNFQPGGIF